MATRTATASSSGGTANGISGCGRSLRPLPFRKQRELHALPRTNGPASQRSTSTGSQNGNDRYVMPLLRELKPARVFDWRFELGTHTLAVESPAPELRAPVERGLVDAFIADPGQHITATSISASTTTTSSRACRHRHRRRTAGSGRPLQSPAASAPPPPPLPAGACKLRPLGRAPCRLVRLQCSHLPLQSVPSGRCKFLHIGRMCVGFGSGVPATSPALRGRIFALRPELSNTGIAL